MEQPNLSYIKELSGGDSTFEKKILDVLRTEFPIEVKEYSENMSNHAFAKAAENVHKIKHKLGIVGLVEGYELAISYEKQLKENNTALQSSFEEVLKAVSDFIKKL